MPSRNRRIISRLTAGRRPVAELTAVWALTVAIILLFAHVTAIGPILLTLSRTHGVHLGDVVFTLAAFAIAVMITLQLARERR
jgi:hypothetical protein